MSTTNDGKRATTVQKRASVAPRTVTAVSRGEVGPTPRQPRKRAQNRSQPVHTHVKVDRRVMTAAKKLCTGSYTRIEIVDHETVIVR